MFGRSIGMSHFILYGFIIGSNLFHDRLQSHKSSSEIDQNRFPIFFHVVGYTTNLLNIEVHQALLHNL